MKTLFSQSAFSRKSYIPLLYPYLLIFNMIRGIRAVVDGEYFATKGTFKNKGLIRSHYIIFILIP